MYLCKLAQVTNPNNVNKNIFKMTFTVSFRYIKFDVRIEVFLQLLTIVMYGYIYTIHVHMHTRVINTMNIIGNIKAAFVPASHNLTFSNMYLLISFEHCVWHRYKNSEPHSLSSPHFRVRVGSGYRVENSRQLRVPVPWSRCSPTVTQNM